MKKFMMMMIMTMMLMIIEASITNTTVRESPTFPILNTTFLSTTQYPLKEVRQSVSQYNVH